MAEIKKRADQTKPFAVYQDDDGNQVQTVFVHPDSSGGGGGSSPTNITITKDANTVTVVSSTGADGTITSADGTNAGIMTSAMQTKLSDLPTNAALTTQINTQADARISVQKAASNGLASLDSSGKLTTSQIPDALVGAINYQGTWNASTNVRSPQGTAMPAASSSNKGNYYIVSTAGTTNIDGINDWGVTDWIVSNGSAWGKVDNTDAGGGDPASIRATPLTGLDTSTTTLPTATDTILSAFGKLVGWAGTVAAQVRATVLTGLSTASATDVSATDSVLVGIGKLQGKFAVLGDTIRNTVLTGYVAGSNTALAAGDSILGAFQKVQGQISALSTSVSGKANTSDTLAVFAPTTSTQLAGVISDETGSGALVFATSPSLVTPVLGTPTSVTLTNGTGLPLSTGISGFGTGVVTFLGVPSSANLLSALTDKTGTGVNVFATSPTLVTPNLGTPSAAVLTNATGLPISTGVAGLAAGIAAFLATPSSANLLTAMTDKTGTGLQVFGTSPTLITPILGTPVSVTLTNGTGLPISTGVSGLATGVAAFLATPSSANLAATLTDKTGTGVAVFSTSPTFTTPTASSPRNILAAPGANNTYVGQSFTAGNADTGGVAQWQAVYIMSTGNVALASATGTSTYPADGIAVAAVAAGSPVTILDDGIARNDSWTWTPGGKVYLSATAGGLTQTKPTASGSNQQCIGKAISATAIRVRIGSGEYVTV